MSFLPQNKFVDGVIAYAEGVAIFIAGLLLVFGAVILVLSGGYLVVAYFQKLLGIDISLFNIKAIDVINRSESLMFFALAFPIETLVGLLAIGWNGIGQIIYDAINFAINFINSFIIDSLAGVISLGHISNVTWIKQDTSQWVTIITQIQTNLQSILFPPLT